LTSIFIPASLTEFTTREWGSKLEFYKCQAFVTVHPDNQKFTSRDGKLAYKSVKAAGRAGKLKWKISGNVLTISGNGEMPAYDDDDDFFISSKRKSHVAKIRSPWFIYRKMIRKIVFKGNIAIQHEKAFYKPYHLSSVTFENSAVPHFSKRPLNVNDIIDRVFHGYTFIDYWDFDRWFSWQIPRMLKQTGISRSKKQIFDRMIFCFSEMTRPYDKEDNKKMKAYREKMKNEGFELLSKHFREIGW